MLVCYRTRRRIGAYLDGALGARASRVTAWHLRGCTRCHAEAEALRRLRGALNAVLAPPPVVEWDGFWAGIVQGIEREGAPARSGLPWGVRAWLGPRLALGGALAAAAIVGVTTMWSSGPDPTSTESAVVVNAASSDHPAATVMVYAPPERDLAVVWVFDLE